MVCHRRKWNPNATQVSSVKYGCFRRVGGRALAARSRHAVPLQSDLVRPAGLPMLWLAHGHPAETLCLLPSPRGRTNGDRHAARPIATGRRPVQVQVFSVPATTTIGAAGPSARSADSPTNLSDRSGLPISTVSSRYRRGVRPPSRRQHGSSRSPPCGCCIACGGFDGPRVPRTRCCLGFDFGIT